MTAHKKARLIRMLFCDFCGLSQKAYALLIEGRDKVHICDDCISVCVDMIAADQNASRPTVEAPPAADAVDPVG